MYAKKISSISATILALVIGAVWLAAIVAISHNAYAQPDTLWTKTFGGSGRDYGNSVQQISNDGLCTMIYQPDPIEGKDAAVITHPYLDFEDINLGSDIYCGAAVSDGGTSSRGLIEFNIAGLPYPAISAELQMHGLPRALQYPYGPVRGDVSIYQVTSPWDEMTVTWNTMPSFDGTPIETETPDTERWYEWDITTLYNEWKSGASDNYGTILINHLEGTSVTGINFKSSDNEGLFFRPKLIITYMAQPYSVFQ